MRARISRMVVGSMIICLGVLILAEKLEYIQSIRLEKWWWTLFIIVPCFSSIINYGVRVHNTVGLLIGVWLFADGLGVIPDNFADVAFWPIVLAVIGITIMFGGFGRHTYHYEKTVNVEFDNGNVNTKNPKGGFDFNDKIDYVAVFSGHESKNNSQSLSGGEVTAVFGSIEVDLSEANITRDIKIEVTGVFGNAVVRMPRNANVVVKKTAVLGRVYSVYGNGGAVSVPTIYVEATGVFGSVEIL